MARRSRTPPARSGFPLFAYAFRNSARGSAFAIGWTAAQLLQRQRLADIVASRAFAGIALIGAAMAVLVAGKHLGRGALGWSVLTGLTIAAYTVIDAHGVRTAPTPASYIVWLFVVMGAVVVAMFGIASKGALFAAAARQWRPGVIAGALSIVTYGFALTAFSLGPTAPLAALRETGMITALGIAVFALGERVTLRRVAAVAGILGGAVLILVG